MCSAAWTCIKIAWLQDIVHNDFKNLVTRMLAPRPMPKELAKVCLAGVRRAGRAAAIAATPTW
jgi:hypothetical protein